MSPEFFGPGNFGPLDQSFSKLWSGEPLFQEFCSPGHILSQIEISMTGKHNPHDSGILSDSRDILAALEAYILYTNMAAVSTSLVTRD